MAPNKFEEHIKEKLENRTLQPSQDAWKALSERLDNQSQKNKNTSYWWLGLAASMVGILLVTTLFYKKDVDANPVIVNNPNSIEQNDSEKEFKIKVVTRDSNKSLEPELKKEIINNKKVVVANNSDTQYKELKKEPVKLAEVATNELTFEEEKINAVVAQIKSLKDNNLEVTDSEIDILLLKAQKEINLHKLIDKTTGVVDARLLLQEVETDIDQSFRRKVFEALKEGLGTVKSAVANRNN
ncbi:hypothetical protein [Confluentibacter sediminis]|uniref:hypothetical protein n=1 Tax=Confluentibacter sediminis TaxID=2219045 RepID=UPI000DAC0151|nr:hypothetical protein [Confluentibacter sediminis]